MKKIKDFIYNISDIAVALLILVIALGVVFWRVGDIMDYPSRILAAEESAVTHDPAADPVNDPVADPITDPEADAAAAPGENLDEQGQEGVLPQDETGEPQEPGEDITDPGDLWEEGKLTRDVEVKVSGNTATACVRCLTDAGLLEDFSEFKALCNEIGKDYNKIKGGNYTFTAGTTKQDIVKKIAVSK